MMEISDVEAAYIGALAIVTEAACDAERNFYSATRLDSIAIYLRMQLIREMEQYFRDPEPG